MRYRTLNKNWHFNRVYSRGKSYVHPHVVLYVAKNRLGYTRIGLTATKKVGHAVQRNRARRVMRAALCDGLHWSFARCTEPATPEADAKWDKQKAALLERMKRKANKE